MAIIIPDFPELPRNRQPILCERHDHIRGDWFGRDERLLIFEVWTLYLTLGGNGAFQFADREIRQHRGDAMLVRPNTAQRHHIPDPDGRWTFYCAHFRHRPEWDRWLRWPEVDQGIMRMELGATPAFRRMARQFSRVWRAVNSQRLDNLEFGVAELHVLLMWAHQVNPLYAEQRVDNRLQRALDYMMLHLNKPISRRQLAHAAGLSEPQFALLFRRQFAQPPMHYLEDARLERACHLLIETSEPIGQVALRVGFASGAQFARRFHHRRGMTPSEFRARHRG